VANILINKTHITLPGYRELLTYKAASKKGLASLIFQNALFSDITPHVIENGFIPDCLSKLEPEYIAGFVAADGSFFISKPSDVAK
jgi:hypothetical protein